MTTWHVYMPIESAEKSTDDQLESMFIGTAQAIRENLANMKAHGMEVIPAQGCDHRDTTGRCLGHEAVSAERQEGVEIG